MAAGINRFNAAFINYNRGTGIIRLIGTISLIGYEFRVVFAIHQDTSYTTADICPATNNSKTDVTGIICINIYIDTNVGKNITLVFLSATDRRDQNNGQ